MYVEARSLDARAKTAFVDGEKDRSTADKYVRLTVVLASILFLVGISTHFPYRGVRYGLIGVGVALLVLSLIQLAPAAAASVLSPSALALRLLLHGAGRSESLKSA